MSPEAPCFLSEQITCRDQEFDTGDSLFYFTSFTIFRGCSSILRPRTLSESELEDSKTRRRMDAKARTIYRSSLSAFHPGPRRTGKNTRLALRSSLAGVAFRADGGLPSGGRARSESVSASCAMVGWALSIGLIDSPLSHWTHVTSRAPGRGRRRRRAHPWRGEDDRIHGGRGEGDQGSETGPRARHVERRVRAASRVEPRRRRRTQA